MAQMVKVHTFQSSLSYFQQQKKKKRGVFTNALRGGRRTIFKLLGSLPKITDGINGERCILFRRVWLTFNNNKKKEKKSGVFTNAGGGGRGTIFKLLGMLPKITDRITTTTTKKRNFH